MLAIAENALYRSVAIFFLIFVIAPAGLIFVGNLIYIVVESIKELRKGQKNRKE